MQEDYDALHLDFDTALDYIVERAGNINVYDIKIDNDYEGTHLVSQSFFNLTSATLPFSKTSTNLIPKSSMILNPIKFMMHSTLTS